MNGVLAAFLEQIAESPDRGGGLEDFQPVPGFRSVLLLDTLGFFALFPALKKSEVRRESESEGGSSWTRAADDQE